MAKTVYHTRSFPAPMAQQQAAAVPVARLHGMAQQANGPVQRQAAAQVGAQGAGARRSGLLLLVGCMVLALMAVLLVPLMVGGSVAPTASKTTAATAPAAASFVTYTSPQEAAEAIDLAAVLPTALPEGFAISASRALEGNVLEVEYSNGRQVILYRTAAGSDDLSGGEFSTYAFTATEAADAVSRGYAGVSEKKLNMAVWAYKGRSYAILAQDGLPAEEMRQLAESIT